MSFLKSAATTAVVVLVVLAIVPRVPWLDNLVNPS